MTDSKEKATAAVPLAGVAAGQAIGLEILRAEMDLLRAVLPGLGSGPVVEDEEERLRHEAEVEDGFDNMPI